MVILLNPAYCDLALANRNLNLFTYMTYIYAGKWKDECSQYCIFMLLNENLNVLIQYILCLHVDANVCKWNFNVPILYPWYLHAILTWLIKTYTNVCCISMLVNEKLNVLYRVSMLVRKNLNDLVLFPSW